MSKKTLYLCLFLLLACVGAAKWHHHIDKQEYEFQLDSDLYVMKQLVLRIEERDAYIAQLEAFIAPEIEIDVEPTRIPDAGEELRPQ